MNKIDKTRAIATENRHRTYITPVKTQTLTAVSIRRAAQYAYNNVESLKIRCNQIQQYSDTQKSIKLTNSYKTFHRAAELQSFINSVVDHDL